MLWQAYMLHNTKEMWCRRESNPRPQGNLQGHERGVAAGGRRSSVAECWQLKPEALGSTPGSVSFLSCPLQFQRSMDSDGPDYVFQLGTISMIGLRTIEEPRPSVSSPCCDYACDLSYIKYTHSNQL